MKLCETCKWWGFGQFAYETQYENCTAKMCGKIKMLDHADSTNPNHDAPVETTYTINDNGRVVDMKEIMRHKAFCVDGSSYRAELVTRPDFGCVLHED